MNMKWYVLASLILLVLHGAVHIMGFVAYWPLREIAELPYKTSFWGGRWEFGVLGTRIFALVWLLTAVGFIGAAAALWQNQVWAVPLLLLVTLLSLALTTVDWSVAYRGVVINLLILVVLILSTRIPQLIRPFTEQYG
jgi:hypothetical protein